ncbi:LTA synthase family protein [Methylobacillus gramineus]|uniref:LTA synthase family protein n=1 Tax=Methylobacillus gramineus TaxID=755169 RepID=UPI001CFF5F1C|nr:LTA synthase family protein [Methylobacillus gramineus]MCB5184300.1 LTA synthase family protein [Methylobacillus gramineus]
MAYAKQANIAVRLRASTWNFARLFGPYAPLVVMTLVALVIFTLSRAGLVIWQLERVTAVASWQEVLLHGLRVDTIQIGLMWLPAVLLAPLFAFGSAWKNWRRFTYFWVVLCTSAIILLELSTPGFIAEYDSRPNRLFVEYLKYPHEVLSMLWGGFKIHLFAGVIGTAITALVMGWFMRPWLSQEIRWSRLKLWLWPLIFLLTALVIRGTISHRPANPAMFARTTDSMVNSLILDSPWSLIHAIYSLKHENTSSDIYGNMPEEEIFRLVQQTRQRFDAGFNPAANEALPTLTHLKPTRQRDRPLNLVIILEESLGATFVQSLGGVPVTPELEKLKEQGWWFEQMYATGTRSVRGIEAVVTGFQPTPAQSVVKLSLSQRNFFTIASLLEAKGYSTEFIYGGESHFDNMVGFFMGNGFQREQDQDSYVNPAFVGSWGASDEDLFNKTHEEISASHASGKPFFTLVFTSSNHAPFEFPDGRIALHDPVKATDNNAVKYADYALGQFFKKAQQSEYWKDTLFIVVADHDIRVHGHDMVPLEHFHIPALILGADITPRKIQTVASQIDLPVTALSLMGIEAEHPMTGRDISREGGDPIGRAMMQFEQNFAWMEGNKVVVLRPEKAPAHGTWDVKNKKFTSVPNGPQDMEQRALANSLLPALLYREQRYHLPTAE